ESLAGATRGKQAGDAVAGLPLDVLAIALLIELEVGRDRRRSAGKETFAEVVGQLGGRESCHGALLGYDAGIRLGFSPVSGVDLKVDLNTGHARRETMRLQTKWWMNQCTESIYR